jgi:two-component system cell cycle response regulator CpdR
MLVRASPEGRNPTVTRSAGPIPIQELIGLRDECRADGQLLELDLQAKGSVREPALVGRVLRDLVERAWAHTTRKRPVRLRTRDLRDGREPGEWVEVVIEAPMSAEMHVWARIAAPVLVEPEQGSSDLATLEVARPADRATTLRLRLPLVRTIAPGAGRGPVVLVAEDDHLVRESVAETLRAEGYEVLSAPNGEAALESLDLLARPIDLLLTDILMPRMNGLELARRFAARRPGGKVLFLSAMPGPWGGSSLPGAIVPKPLDLTVLLERLPDLVASTLAPAIVA